MIPDKTINDLITKHANLERELSSGDVDKKFFAEKSKEYSDLNEIIEDAKKYLSFEKDKKELEKIIKTQQHIINKMTDKIKELNLRLSQR